MKIYKKIFKDIIFVSKLTNVNKKKARILFTIITSNAVVAVDLGIIILFSVIFTGNINYQNQYLVESINFLLKFKFLLILIVIFRFFLILLERFNIYYLQIQVEKNLKLHIMNEIFVKGNYSTADTYFYLNSLTGHLGFFYGAITSTFNSFIQILGYTFFLILTNSTVMSYFLIGLVIVYFPTKKLILKAREYMHKQYDYSRKLSFHIQRIVDNIFLIKILKTWDKEFYQYDLNLEENKKSQAFNNIYSTVNSLIPNSLTLLILVVIVNFFDITSLLTLEFIAILLRLFQSIGNLSNSLNMAVNSHVHIEKLVQFENNKIDSSNRYHIKPKLENAVEFVNCNFKYFDSKELIFENLNLKIAKGKHTIITGPNGSGKSTLLGLISSVYFPQNGEITLSSEKLGYVGVTPLIIQASLRENLYYGNSKKIDDNIILNYLDEFKVFDVGMNYDLDKEISNKTLSSGQMQKISFIRALLNDVEILLLDESTSNLDVDSKLLIFNILKNKKVTIINSTHSKDDFSYDYEIIITMDNMKRILTYK